MAVRLQYLLDEVVFVGGSAAAFLITDESIVAVRPTLDVDLIVEVFNLPEFFHFEKRLKKLGFVHDKDGPRCRYRIDQIVVDVMPDDESILGFTNRWYRTALDTADGSHDMEDLLAVIDGRPSIVRDCYAAPEGVPAYLREQFSALLDDDEFLNVMPGFVDQSQANERASVLIGRMQDLAKVLK